MLNRKLFGRLFAVIAAASIMPGLVHAQNIPVAKNVVLVRIA
jgi:hypothetical protein